ncbi:sensor histidine kinase [Natronorubrum thiooxidans]|uniref:histidine kinase n=1 Tax=Natronorubrum thiooxidans TaxID=308853 RepID=A0A1N7G7B5_9EURY|nr:histidine kinase N-terminal 7TM domain-containing protein [Natronorubrum thiooxidans]SIS08503.1 PAS/PAC sensor signal transduction histidine kinase [Natronorubrum thiooxidans]
MIGWEWQWTAFTPILVAAAIVMGTIGTYAWNNRDATGAVPFAALMAATSLWAFAYALQLAGATVATKLFWANIVHIGVAIVPVAWFCFALQFTGRGHWVTRRTIGALSVVPAVYLVLVFTNEAHRFVRVPLGVEAVADASFLIFRQEFGPVFYAHAAYGYALMIAGVVLLVQLSIWSPRIYRRQVGLLLVGAALPMATNAIHHAGFTPVPNFDLTPFSFTITGIGFFIAIYYYRLLDLTPVARNIVVGNLREGVIVTDRDDRIVDLNDAAEHLLGLSEDAIGTRFDTLRPDHAMALERGSDGETATGELVDERRGERRQLELTSAPVYDVRGERIGRSIIVRDITATRELEAELEATIDRLRRSNAELEAFMGVISHDLRGPLRTTEQYLALFEREHRSAIDADGTELLEVARKNTDRMQEMITDLLAYSRIGSVDDEWTAVDCDRVLDDVIDAYRFEIDDRNASVTRDELPTVWGVPHQLRQLFQNLIGNALKYSSDGPPTIHVAATRADDGWRVTVEDDGVGIEPDDLEYVFELFTRADRAGTASGSGMGLAICKKIVDRHGGTIEIDSTPDVGTTVAVTVPDGPSGRKK